MRLENTALKLKISSLQDKVTRSAASQKALQHMSAQITALRQERATLSVEAETAVDSLMRLMQTAHQYALQARIQHERQMHDLTARYLKEQTQRRLYYNKLQELRGNIRVFVRVRRDDRAPSIFANVSDQEVCLPKLQGGEETMEFEHCYGPSTQQETVFEDTKPIILSCVDGYNVCLIAYGQTGSGKTFTMMGPPENPGVNRRAIRELLEQCNARENVDYDISVSLVEVYNEKIFDLLSEHRGADLKIHAGPEGTYVAGATQHRVTTVAEVEQVMALGDKHRSVGATLMNTDSSRSHLLLQLQVKGVDRISKATSCGKLTLVDLAGSERVSKTQSSGQRLVEAAAINKSLTALGQVFKALACHAPHVPYRNSKLTHILQDSLGGDSKTAVFINVSPLASVSGEGKKEVTGRRRERGKEEERRGDKKTWRIQQDR